jgi:hypothetical protein
MTLECRCDHCPAVLTFEEDRVGERVECPNCRAETALRYAPTGPPPPIIAPVPSTPQVPQVPRCLMCGGLIAYRGHKFTTPGMLVLLFGILLTPILIGIVMILVSLSMREARYGCSACGKAVS